jgi:hypothetical protein
MHTASLFYLPGIITHIYGIAQEQEDNIFVSNQCNRQEALHFPKEFPLTILNYLNTHQDGKHHEEPYQYGIIAECCNPY